MSLDSKPQTSPRAQASPPLPETTRRLADEPGWVWDEVSVDATPRWHFRWPSAALASRHHTLLHELARGALAIPTEAPSRFSAAHWADARDGAPFAQAPTPEHTPALMRSLGQALRQLHNHPCPDGFGVPERLHLPQTSYFQTFNAAMAAHLDRLAGRLDAVHAPEAHARFTERFAWLRQSLSAFHPRTRSVWTLGQLSPGRILVSADHNRIVAFLDFSHCALRPPEHDLAHALRPELATASPRTERAFWSGYGAAPTMDLRRRVHFFSTLAQLEAELPSP
ncbi:hypothetical protein DL240_07610 [Lujinxingia litoralis]|uniref:Aminoglycoside phosphotransferase domain-containing protein n=1 Tax=Lujinxingia litoralis TaxID=2211119 RepID=A0A328CBC3_9DELT|nr:phosphotransferase [Lujinxingia litoralis]RAL22757.1 hypothetical protein DL240_07610 [Lujinxingia litoralis]